VAVGSERRGSSGATLDRRSLDQQEDDDPHEEKFVLHCSDFRCRFQLFATRIGSGGAFAPKPSGSIAGLTMQDSVYKPLTAESHLSKEEMGLSQQRSRQLLTPTQLANYNSTPSDSDPASFARKDKT
jgi:hypothetical protein